jgi:hypothetical protein
MPFTLCLCPSQGKLLYREPFALELSAPTFHSLLALIDTALRRYSSAQFVSDSAAAAAALQQLEALCVVLHVQLVHVRRARELEMQVSGGSGSTNASAKSAGGSEEWLPPAVRNALWQLLYTALPVALRSTSSTPAVLQTGSGSGSGSASASKGGAGPVPSADSTWSGASAQCWPVLTRLALIMEDSFTVLAPTVSQLTALSEYLNPSAGSGAGAGAPGASGRPPRAPLDFKSTQSPPKPHSPYAYSSATPTHSTAAGPGSQSQPAVAAEFSAQYFRLLVVRFSTFQAGQSLVHDLHVRCFFRGRAQAAWLIAYVGVFVCVCLNAVGLRRVSVL